MKFGTWLLGDGSININLAINSDFDFLLLDLEHGQVRFEELSTRVDQIQRAGKIAIVRVGEIDRLVLQRVMDTAPDYVQVAGIITADDFETLDSTLAKIGYSPWSRRSLSGKAQTQIIAQIETRDCLDFFIENEQIAGVSATHYFLGRYDLAISCGHESLSSAEHFVELERFSNRCSALGLTPWTISTSTAEISKLSAMGYAHISYGSDVQFLNGIYNDIGKELRRWN